MPATDRTRLMRDTLAVVGPEMISFAADFYDALFAAAPQMRPLFPEDLAAQTDMLAATLHRALAETAHPGTTRPAGPDARPDPLIAEALLQTLADWFGPGWTARHEAAWSEAIEAVSHRMREGALTAA